MRMRTDWLDWPPEDILAAEEIERRAIVDLAAAMPAAARDRLGLAVESIGHCTAVTASESRAYVFNRVFGLGLSEPTSQAGVDAVVAHARAHSRGFLLHVAPHARPADIERWLEQAGLERYARSWWKLMARMASLAALRADTARDVVVEVATAATMDEIGALFADAFGTGDVTASALVPLLERAGWTIVRAVLETKTAGAALLFVHDRIAYLAGAVTATGLRRRGVHRALLVQRIEAARRLGCRLVVAETGEDLPGECGASLRNMMRMGLEPAYLRSNFVPAGYARLAT